MNLERNNFDAEERTMTRITSDHFQPGAKWTFVHSFGKETEYVYDRLIIAASADPKKNSPGLSAMHALLNRATGKYAEVSEKWMREPQINGGSHWVAKAEAPALAEAA